MLHGRLHKEISREASDFNQVNLLAHEELHLLGRRVDAFVCLGECQLRCVLLVYLQYNIAQSHTRFIRNATGCYL